MVFDTILAKVYENQDKELKIPIQKDEIMTQFIENMVANLQCLGEEANPNMLLLLGFFWLHIVSHLEFECLPC